MTILLSVLLCSTAGTATPGTHKHAIEHDGLERSYLLHVPPQYDGASLAPLVVVIHGYASSPKQVISYTDMSAKSDQEGFLVAYPRGAGVPRWSTSWNAGFCCGNPQRKNVDDVGFIAAMLDDIQRRYAVDPARVYAAGLSVGGMMVHRLGCELPERFAAIAVVAGAFNYDGEPAAVPVPILMFHSRHDPAVPYDGGKPKFWMPRAVSNRPVSYAVSFWRTANRGAFEPERTEIDGAAVETYPAEPGGAPTILYTLESHSHYWPGYHRWYVPGKYESRVPANEIIWSFFQQHSRE